jgi:radical SAM protein with 4Fe4S-binding SPASM domain
MRTPDLTYLFWQSTLRCNLRCPHCGSSCGPTSPVEELDTQEILGIVRSIAEDFDARRIFVSITGGEPLLRADLVEVVAEMTRLGLRSCIVTNGTLLDDAQARQLYDAGMRTVTVSVDGVGPDHEAIRGRGSYRKALAALRAARDAGFVDVEAVTCVRPANLDSFAAIEQAVRDAGANLWRLITIDTMGRLSGTRGGELWLDARGLAETLDWIERRRGQLQRAREPFGVQFSCGGFLGVRREGQCRPVDSQCMAGLQVGSILCDGSVGACPSLPRSWAQGSARSERFAAIWRREFQKHRSTAWRRTGACDGCGWFDLCLGGGLHERVAQPEDHCWLLRQQRE